MGQYVLPANWKKHCVRVCENLSNYYLATDKKNLVVYIIGHDVLSDRTMNMWILLEYPDKMFLTPG